MRPARRRAALALIALIAFGPACEPAPPPRDGGLLTAPVVAPGFEGRLDAALARAGGVALGEEGAGRVKSYGGVIFADSTDELYGLPLDQEARSALADPALRALLLGQDEGAAADALRAAGAKVLLLRAAVTPSIDRGRRVLSRLYHHDELSRFQLFRVEEGLLYYKINEQPLQLPPALATAGITYLRQRLRGNRITGFPDVQGEEKVFTLMATLRGQGQELVVAFGQDERFQGALEELAVDLERDHRRRVELAGAPPLREHIEDLRIELHRVVERAAVVPRSEAALEALWEPGIDGARIVSEKGGERAALPGAAAYTRSLRTADAFLRVAAQLGGMTERRPWREPEAELELIRTIHYAEIPGSPPADGQPAAPKVAYYYRGVPAVPMGQVTVAAVKAGIVAAGDWYLANMAEDGLLVYKMWPSENRYSDEYNHVRHTLGTWNLVLAWRMDPRRADFLEGARRALRWSDQYLVREPHPQTGEPMAFYHFAGNQKLGSVVVNLLGIVDLARATGSREWDEQLREMGRFILFMQDPDGSFRGYHVPPSHPYHNAKNDIVPGEAALALVTLADYFNDDAWIASLPRYFSYYQPWFHQRAERRRLDRVWPADFYENQDRLDLVQFGPWTVMAANAYHRRTGDAEAAAFGLEVARWMVDSYQWTEENAPFPDYVGGYYKLPGELPAMQAFCYAEGTAAAYQLARRFRPDEAAWFEAATRRTLRFALQMQYDEVNTYPFSRPDQVLGGIRYAMNETKVRVDYVHHALSAMVQWVDGAVDDPALAAEVRDGPVTPVQRAQLERRAARAAALAAGDAATAAAHAPPWGERPRTWVPPIRFAIPKGPMSQVDAAPAPAAGEDDED